VLTGKNENGILLKSLLSEDRNCTLKTKQIIRQQILVEALFMRAEASQRLL
jgi:hypothetical protein